jgi:hypothetical protein
LSGALDPCEVETPVVVNKLICLDEDLVGECKCVETISVWVVVADVEKAVSLVVISAVDDFSFGHIVELGSIDVTIPEVGLSVATDGVKDE